MSSVPIPLLVLDLPAGNILVNTPPPSPAQRYRRTIALVLHKAFSARPRQDAGCCIHAGCSLRLPVVSRYVPDSRPHQRKKAISSYKVLKAEQRYALFASRSTAASRKSAPVWARRWYRPPAAYCWKITIDITAENRVTRTRWSAEEPPQDRRGQSRSTL